MEQDDDVKKDCGEKLGFLTQREADTARIAANWQHDTDNLEIYLCEDCGLYHLSSSYRDNDI